MVTHQLKLAIIPEISALLHPVAEHKELALLSTHLNRVIHSPMVVTDDHDIVAFVELPGEVILD